MNPENLRVLAAGRDSAFWKALKEELFSAAVEATENLVLVAPEKMAEICELQQIVRAARNVINLVENSAEEIKLMEEEPNG